ncbi:MAG: hypothetical protein IID36_06270 [Planctomycetes bacterium]|nr:hypothetical protein [Planctomycetota bacterium]
MKVDDLVTRADQLLEMGASVVSTRHSGTYGSEDVDWAQMKGFRAAALSFIERVYGATHSHFDEFKTVTEDNYVSSAEAGIAILQAIRSELAGGWLFTMKSLVVAEVFADFMSMAEHLLETHYKDAAAVICGSVLEEHLRQLCSKSNIPTEADKKGRSVPRKADSLNADLAKNDVYSKLDQKSVTAWLDLRNSAAHGKYAEYDLDQARQMLHGVTQFMARVAP